MRVGAPRRRGAAVRAVLRPRDSVPFRSGATPPPMEAVKGGFRGCWTVCAVVVGRPQPIGE
eukprot:8326074-Lingulodinium_polyedra.AAC.1